MSNIQSRVFEGASAVTKSDTVDDPAGPFAALLVSADGTIKLTSLRGDVVSFTAVAGFQIPIVTRRVWSTGTTATVIGLLSFPYKGPQPTSWP